jgi:hypothetical protein
VVRLDAKNIVANFRRQMPVSQMPGKAHKLLRVPVPDFDDGLRSRLNLEPSAIFELQAIAVSHRDSLGKIEQYVFSLIGGQPNSAAMARVEVERDRACGVLCRPLPGGSMN